VCDVHEGRILSKGMANIHYKDGRHSKYLPRRLKDRYLEAADDTDMLVMKYDIALIDTRISDLLQKVDSGESGALWRTLNALWGKMESAKARGDKDTIVETLNEIGALLKRGASDHANWKQISELLDQRRRTGESERKRLIEANQLLTVQEAMTFMHSLTDAVRKHVTDRTTLGKISNEFAELISRGSNSEIIT